MVEKTKSVLLTGNALIRILVSFLGGFRLILKGFSRGKRRNYLGHKISAFESRTETIAQGTLEGHSKSIHLLERKCLISLLKRENRDFFLSVKSQILFSLQTYPRMQNSIEPNVY